jgi:hypothetical protein
MLNPRKIIHRGGYLLLAVLICGCGSSKKIVSEDIPGKSMANEESPTAKPKLIALSHYVVKRHDNLWEIAGRPGIYSDSFEWPLLFKANRDEIKDPDLIYPRQDLKVRTGISMEDINQAKQLASATPRFVPHSKPRETLPVDYF